MTDSARQGLRCGEHDDDALYRCCECGEVLCQQCIEVGSHLIICRLCGERAIELDELERPRPNAGERAARQRAQTASQPVPQATSGDGGIYFADHVVVPTAIIAMVSALLFFLLDVRSVFLGGTAALKQVGFFFCMATVLIARYGRGAGAGERQGVYTFFLGGATLLAMTVAPWEPSSAGPARSIANLVIILAVWRFATRLTASLSLHHLPSTPRPRLYGRAQLELDAWRQARDEALGLSKTEESEDAPPPNASRSVTRLVCIGLVLFALGEPFLLAGPSVVASRALAAMIVFLLASGLLLATGASLQAIHRVKSHGGETSASDIPRRLASAATVMVVVLGLGLAMPGVEYRGSGILRPPSVASGTEDESGRTEGRAEEPGEESQADRSPTERSRQDDSSRGRDESGREGDRGDNRGRSPGSSTALSLIAFFEQLGLWLRVPLLIVAALAGLYALTRLRLGFGFLENWRGALSALTARFAAGLRDLFRRREHRVESLADPLANLQALHDLEPRDAVLAAYARLLACFEQLGHERAERQTPYEFLAALPQRIGRLKPPAQQLTDLYVQVAYAEARAGTTEQRQAVRSLEELAALQATA